MNFNSKIIVLIIISGCLVYGGDGQESELYVSLQSGLNSARLESNSPEISPPPYESRISRLYIAAILEFRHESGFSIGSGLGYSGSGGKWDQELLLTNMEGTLQARVNPVIETNFFEIPLHVRYSILSKKVKVFLEGGGTTGILRSAKLTFNVISGNRPSNNEPDLKEFTRDINFSLDFGGGISIPLNQRVEAGLSARYGLGQIDLNDEARNDQERKSRDLKIFAGLALKL